MRKEDFQLIQLEASPAMFASFEKGGCEGAVSTMPSFFLAEERVSASWPIPLTWIFITCKTPSTPLEATSSQSGPGSRFVKGLLEGLAYFRKYKKESLEVMQKKLRIQSAQEKDIKYLKLPTIF